MNWSPSFEPSLINDVPDEHFVIIINQFFNFRKSFTIKTRKAEFNKWLKEHWDCFISDNFEELCNKICMTLQDYNEENPDYQVPFINWIPNYGGLLCEPTRFPTELEERFREAHHIHFVAPLPIEEPPALVQRLRNPHPEEVEFLNPDDVAYN
jgi:hypothetical protein